MKLLLSILLMVFVFDVTRTQQITGVVSLNGPHRSPATFDIAFAQNSIAYVADTIRLMKTTNGGNDWFATPVVIASPHLVSVNPFDDNFLVVAKGDTVFTSDDGGVHWDPKITTSRSNRFSRSPNNDTISPNIVWAGLNYVEDNNQRFSSLYYTQNSGLSFVAVKYFRDSIKTNITDIAVKPGDDNEVWVCGTNSGQYADSNGVWKTLDAGNGAFSAWERVRIPGASRSVKYSAIAMDVEGKIFIGTTSGDIYRCTDAGANVWSKVFNGSTSYSINALKYVDENKVIALTTKDIFYSSSGGDSGTWIKVTVENISQGFHWKKPLMQNIVVDKNNPATWYVCAKSGMYKTEDAGADWIECGTASLVVPSDVVVANNNYVFSIRMPKLTKKRNENELGGVDRYSLNTNEWTQLSFGVYDDSAFVCQKIFSDTDGKIYALGSINKKRGKILVSNNAGDSWSLAHQSGRNGSDFYGMIRKDNALLAFGKKITPFTNIVACTTSGEWFEYAPAKIMTKGAVLDIAAVDDNENRSIKLYALLSGSYDNLMELTYQDTSIKWLNVPLSPKAKTLMNVSVRSKFGASDVYFIAGKNYLYKGGVGQYEGSYRQALVFSDVLFTIKEDNPDILVMTHTDSAQQSGDIISNMLYNFNVRRIFSMWAQPTGISSIFTLYCATDQGVFQFEVCTNCTSGSIPIVLNPPQNNNVIIRRGEEEYFTRDVFIPSGSVFMMEDDAMALFEEGVALRIEGELIIRGLPDRPAKLKPAYEAARWQGVYVAPGATALLEYAEIQGASVGIFDAKANLAINNSTITQSHIGVAMYGSDDETPMIDSSHFSNNIWGIVMANGAQALLNGNTIENNQKGIVIDASSPLLYGNTISNNTQVGVAVYGGGYPRFGDIALNSSGMNIVQNNALTQLMTVNSYAFLGFLRRDCLTELGGGNLFTGADPDEPLCVAVEQSAISSLATDWGMATLSRNSFLQDSNSQIVYQCLSQTPHTEEELLLWNALEHRSLGAYSLSKEEYINVLHYPDARPEEALQALAGLTSVVALEYDETENETVLEEYRAELSYAAENHNSSDVRSAALQLLALDASRNENEYTAYQKFLNLQTLPMGDDAKISAMFSRNLFEASDLEYDDEALATAELMNTLYADDERSQIAGVLTEMVTKHSLPQQFSKRRKFSAAMRKFPSRTEHTSTLPTSFALYQNFPNPFNPVTTVKFDVAEESKVELTIYDLLGRKVTTLINEMKPAGRYSFVWNAGVYASGVYYLRMNVEGRYTQVKKILLMK
ncbi:MAG: right-handed parallel beta-helix repeat-containing protein [Bacteroidota bacterium]